ncbi:MAG TPA: bifunctional phosphopantothenoylcysteine decarboxylase/phosphopantothenate--cysteine ligase CoaBC [Thermopetrobacter sp.]|nr:bifunctional phosphopantothenoylcysteine decarboxylase/phosphopantothenate--cysteine ligase CoaBC [Thermopetrobacter sp.]
MNNRHRPLRGRRVLLIVGGGIAAYKALELIRLLRAAGAAVSPVLTRGGRHFVTPLSLAALAGEKVHEDLFSLTDEVEMGHIALARAADVVVVAPATADLMARMAGGHADDLATTLLLATTAPVLVAPAMNARMWEHPATRRNVAQLRADGVRMVGPESGDLACGEEGPGRMAEPAAILAAVEALLAAPEEAAAVPEETTMDAATLDGAHVLVTAGPTREPIDPVRYIANRSSGRQGFALARAAAELGARVTLVHGPVNLPCPPGADCVAVETAREMLAAVRAALPADIAVFAAAVADWRVAETGAAKLKKTGEPPRLTLVENPDILATVAGMEEGRPALVVGFAAETGDPLPAAREKLARKGADLIVANDVSPARGVFGGADNEVVLVTAGDAERWPRMDKLALARRLLRRLARAWRQRREG